MTPSLQHAASSSTTNPSSPPPAAIAESLKKARAAQPAWAASPLGDRLSILRALRKNIANGGCEALAEAAAEIRERSRAEALSSEVLPLLDACRFLERKAHAVLTEKSPGARLRPFWLAGSRLRIRREPLGTILVVGPSNYPLFLPGIQLLQALIAGNAVAVKPAPGASAPMQLLADALTSAGLPDDLVQILPEHRDAARAAIDHGVDKVVLTGSAETGRAILALCQERLIPAVMELSGCDAVFVRADADAQTVAEALFAGLQMNDGRTCIAPRRIFVHRNVAKALEDSLQAISFSRNSNRVSANDRLIGAIRDALNTGARAVLGSIENDGDFISAPLILADVPPDSPLRREDFFAPVASLIAVESDAEALALDAECPYALGASIFGREMGAARELADRIDAGCVTVNDLIIPTADPRLPFGGRRRSGFGSTRGAEGLLEMTVPKGITERKAGGSLPHFKPLTPGHETLFQSYIRLAHGTGLGHRAAALSRLCNALVKISKAQSGEAHPDKDTKP